MKLLIAGGGGDMGSFIVRDSIQSSIWTEITIADIDESSSRKLISELKDSRISYIKMDANNHEQMVHIFQKYNIVCSAIGPFYLFGPKVARACIEAKVPLVDICDDSGPTLEILQMDETAKQAKIPILLGYGWTPGLTNLMVRHAYSKLDKSSSKSFDISWAGGAADSEGLAVIMHVLYAVTGRFPSYQNGEFIDVPAGKGNVKIDFPAPLGIIGVFDCGHPEPVTIPKFLGSDIKRVTLKGGLTPDWNNKFAASMKQLHLTQGRTRKKVLSKFVHLTERVFETGGVAASSARVDIYGSKDGKQVHWVYCTPSIVMGKLTGYSASIAAQLLAKGIIKGTGVLPPEALPVEIPKMFFDEMKKRDIEIIFDEGDPLDIFKNPIPYTPKFLSEYGLTILIIIGFLGLLIVIFRLLTVLF